MENAKLRGPSACVRCASPRNILQALALMLLMLVINVGALSAQQTPVSYLSPVFHFVEADTVGVEGWNTLSCTSYTPVIASLTTWGAAGTDSWYVVNSNCSIMSSVTCLGNVHLILMNGKTLTATQGIKEEGGTGNSLTIYAQDTAKTVMGVLIATGITNAAGIGGYLGDGSNITINGGNVTATGGMYSAGIGSGSYENCGECSFIGKNITINGGYVTATGGYCGAGIGGGYMSAGSNITINGGNVTASGKCLQSYSSADGGAGIGGGYYAAGSHIIISGGKVQATGGFRASGIGGGIGNSGTAEDAEYQGAGSYITIKGGDVTAKAGTADNDRGGGGSGIGGGCYSIGSHIIISGGKVNAIGNTDPYPSSSSVAICSGAGIGGGGTQDGFYITIDGGTVNAVGGYYAAGIGGGSDGRGSYIYINDGKVEASSEGCGGITGSSAIGSGTNTQCQVSKTANNIYAAANITIKKGNSKPLSNTLTVTEANETTDLATYFASNKYALTEVSVDTVSYLSPVYKTPGDAASGIDHWNTLQRTNYTEVTSSKTSWGIAGKKTWYVVKDNTTISNNVTCYGNVNLILENGFTLTTNAIIETGGTGNSLTIYAQDTTKSVMGKLNANATGVSNNAGIGGGDNANGSNITINGGWITVYGGDNAAGIGGGNCGNGSNITINGGYVTTTGGTSGAGIGGGCTNNSNAGLGSYITINGGNVTATGGTSGAGIGGGYRGNGSHILVNDGYVTANGGDNGAGIGGGNTDNNTGGAGSNITIDGGYVTATGGTNGAGIGSGYFGNASTNITITTGDVTATGGTNADGIGKGNMSSSASNIFVADSILLKAGTSTTLTDANVVAHASATTDIASSLSDKRYAKTEVFADTNYTIYIKSGHAYKNSASSANDITNEIASRGLAFNDGTWTMNNFSFTTTAYTALYISGDASIIVSGTNTITGGDETGRTGSYGLYSHDNLTLSGTGILNVNSGNCYEMNNSTGMHVRGNLTVDGCNVVATAGTTDVDNSISYGMFIGGVFYIGPSASLEGNGGSNTAGFAFSYDHVPTGITVETNTGGDVYILEEYYSAGSVYCTYLDQNRNPANHVVITPAAFTVAGNWNDASKWSCNSVPAATNAVIINAQCTIPSGCDAVCKDMKINSPLYVSSTASLVATSIDNETAANLFIASDEDGTGTVKFTSGTAPKATVEMYFKGHATDNGNKMVDPEWQYRGFIGTPDAGQSLSDIAIYKWDETHNATQSGCWVDRVDPGTSANFAAKTGYSMANYTTAVATRTYTTTLTPVGDVSYTGLTYTGTAETPNRGVNLITNSMSAPINLSDNGITSSNLAESTVYLFNTRSYNSWKSDESAAITTYPLYSGSAIADNFIPAGQSFAVKASADGASLTFPASAISSNESGPMYAPREESEFGILAITAESEDGVDDLFLLESDICDEKFNNGYDGTKMFASNAPQIYATNDYGMTAVNADNTLLGQYIGVRQGSTSNSITMTISRRDLDNYTSLSLYDCVSGTYYDLADDETTITFTATGDQPRRFLISGRRDDGTEYTPTESGSLVVAGDQLMLVNFGRSEAQIMLTDASGKMLWSENSKNGNTFTLPQLPAGVYFISCGKVSTKYITK